MTAVLRFIRTKTNLQKSSKNPVKKEIRKRLCKCNKGTIEQTKSVYKYTPEQLYIIVEIFNVHMNTHYKMTKINVLQVIMKHT